METLRNIQRRISGDQPAHLASDTVASEAQNGVALIGVLTNDDNKNATGEVQGESVEVQTTCAACKKIPASVRGKTSQIECTFCQKLHCMGCADINKKSDITALERPDVFWCCKSCLDEVKRLGPKVQI